MTAKQRAEEIMNFSLLLPEKEQVSLWIDLSRRTREERKKQAKPNKDEIKKLARQLDASVIPNDITMDEIVEECRVVRKERYERTQSHS